MNNKDLNGFKVGRLTVVSFSHLQKNKAGKNVAFWNCLCSCGNSKIVSGHCLGAKNNPVRSCGCLLKDGGKHFYSHGLSKKHKKEYNSYVAMIQRCTDKGFVSYQNYGGRGIVICKRWLKSFKYFFEDMGLKPDPTYTLERKETNKGYSKSNCIWATRQIQSENKRNNIVITYNGKTQILKRWCEEFGLPYRSISARISRDNWNPIEAITTPIRLVRGLNC